MEAELFAVVDALDPQPLVDATMPLWESQIETVGTAELTALGTGLSFNMVNPAVTAHLEQFAGDRIKGLINQTTKDELRATLVEGIRAGEGTRELRKRITDTFTKGNLNIYKVRAETIARTEVHHSSSWAINTARRQSGVVRRRQWVAAMINTRATHAALNGTIKGMDEPFQIGLSSAMYPGNFGVPAEDINCQCTIIAIVDEARGLKQFTEDEAEAMRVAFFESIEPWMDDARTAFIRGFEIQLAAVLAVFDGLTA